MHRSCLYQGAFPLHPEYIEQPSTIGVQNVPAHDQHVEPVPAGTPHNGGIGWQIGRVAVGQDLLHHVQIFFVMGMNVLRIGHFDPVIAPFGQDDRRFFQRSMKIRFSCDPVKLLTAHAFFAK